MNKRGYSAATSGITQNILQTASFGLLLFQGAER